MKVMRWLVAGLVAIGVVACGGGGGGGAGGTTTYFPTLGGPSCATAYVGNPYSCSFIIGGLPPGSTPNLVASGLPPGLLIDLHTGVISGTPNAVGNFSFTLVLSANGASGSVNFDSFIQVNVPMDHAWSQIAASTPFPRFATMTAASLGTDLYVVGSREDNLAIETWRSSNLGVAWTKLASTPTSSVRGFALAGDGTHLMLAGGIDASGSSNDAVWLFSAGSWQRVAPVGPAFGPRWGHTLTWWNNSWVVMAGTTGAAVAANAKADVWQSTDAGSHWTQRVADLSAFVIAPDAIFAPAYGHCAADIGGTLFRIGGSNPSNGLSAANASVFEQQHLWRSDDGAHWTLSGTAQPAATYAACATVAGVYYEIGGTRMDTADMAVVDAAQAMSQGIAHGWSYDGNAFVNTDDASPRRFDFSAAFPQRFGAGAAVVGNQLFIIGGRLTDAPDQVLTDVWVSSR